MKHRIVAVACVATILVLVIVGVSTWHTQQVQDRVKAAQAYARQQYHDQLQKAAVAAEKKRVNDLCHQDQAFYDVQSVAYRKVTARPVCDLKVVE